MSGFLLRVVESLAGGIWVSTEDIPFTRIRRRADSLSIFTVPGNSESDIHFAPPPAGGIYRCFIMNDRGDTIDNFSLGLDDGGQANNDTDIPGGRSVILEDCLDPIIIQHVEIDGGKVRRRLRIPDGGLMTIADCRRLATELLADIALA